MRILLSLTVSQSAGFALLIGCVWGGKGAQLVQHWVGRRSSTCSNKNRNMSDPKRSQPLRPSLSEHTLEQAKTGFERFAIMENYSDNRDEKRQSIVLNNEYDSSESNISDTAVADDLIDMSKRKKVVDKHVKNSKVRFKKDGQMRSNFGDLNFKPRETIFDTEIRFGAKFYGLYIAFWICVLFFGLDVLCGYHINHGNLFQSEIVRLMVKDIVKVALTDFAMYLSLYISVIVQLLIKKGVISWKGTGYYFQSLFELVFLILPNYWADYMKYPWIARIFLMLHGVVMLMKVHSYAFYNGYLWEITSELNFSSKFIKKSDSLDENTKIALNNSIDFCSKELTSQNFPNNISFWNFFEYSMFPVLVYQSSYPRNDNIRLDYLFKKIAGIFGVIFLMIAISQERLYPIVMKCLELQSTTSLIYRLKMYPFILIETIPPFLSVYLLVFYLIWELILNAIAELSKFADREFYRYWWNSVDWNEYARDWNVPVHKFLLRHVYHSSISAFHVNKTAATIFTFFLSSVMHELAMYVIFKKIRFYLLMLQMSQLSLVQLSKTKWMKDKFILGNCIFWFGIVFGPSLMCTMYLVF